MKYLFFFVALLAVTGCMQPQPNVMVNPAPVQPVAPIVVAQPPVVVQPVRPAPQFFFGLDIHSHPNHRHH